MAISPSTRYSGQATAPSASYPAGGAQNVTAQGAGDGTPLDADWLNDWFALQAAILAKGGITNNNTVDTATACQVFQALERSFAPLVLPTGSLTGGVLSATVPLGAATALSTGMYIPILVTSVPGSPGTTSVTVVITPTGGSALSAISLVDRRGRAVPEDAVPTGVHYLTYDGTNLIGDFDFVVVVTGITANGVTVAYTTTTADDIIRADDSGGITTIELSTADFNIPGRTITIATEGQNQSCRVVTEGGETFLNGVNTLQFIGASTQTYPHATYRSDGVRWHLIGGFGLV